MPKYEIDGPDGKTYEIDGPPGATREQIIERVKAGIGKAAEAPQAAPRWDVLGDIGRAASDSASAMTDDISGAFPNPATMDLGPVATAKRMGSALKVPLDAAAVALSPVTGALRGTLGSALSYVVPTTPEGDKYGLQSDPKRAADELVDTSMMMFGPRGMGTPTGPAASLMQRRSLFEAKTKAKTENRARAKVSERLAADDVTPDVWAAAQREAAQTGDPITLMDIGGPNVKGLAGAVHRAPGPARTQMDEFFKKRDLASADSLTRGIQGNVAKGSTYHTTQDLLKSRSNSARGAYDEVGGIGPVHSNRLDEFLGDPEIQEGLRRGLKLERQEARAEGRKMVGSDYAITGYQDGNWDMPIFDKVPTMKAMMVANEGLGAKIAEMVNPQTGRLTKDGVALKKYRDAFQAELDKLSGGKYKTARDAWGGPTQSMEAVREGRLHFSRAESNEEIAAEFNALSESDKEFYRLAAAESKIDQLERAPDASDKSKRIVNSERDRKRFRVLFKSDAEAEKFIASVARQRQMFDTKGDITGNSKTAGRMIEDAESGASPALEIVRGGAQAFGGNWLGAAQSAWRAKRDLGLRNNPEMNSEIARILMDSSIPAANQNSILAPVPVPKAGRPLLVPSIVETLAASRPEQRPKK